MRDRRFVHARTELQGLAMPAARKPAIARAFGSAEDYDAHAHIQRMAAHRLAEIMTALRLPPRPHILEIGCGTGFLSAELVRSLPGGRLLVSDLSEPMVRRTRDLLGGSSAIQYLVMDGERPPFAAGSQFDLICSSLAFQWFEDLGGALAALADRLMPGGHLAFATLAAGTFIEWRTAHEKYGLNAATRDYPSPAEIEALCPPDCTIAIEMQPLVEQHRDGIAFLRGLKAIGANTPWETRPPLPPAAMRGVLRAFANAGASVTYQVAHVVIGKAPEGL